jgi:hypothetical protein
MVDFATAPWTESGSTNHVATGRPHTLAASNSPVSSFAEAMGIYCPFAALVVPVDGPG